MTEAELYRKCDAVLLPFLKEKGFRVTTPGEYLRRWPTGEDRVQVAKGPPSKARTHFSVCMSYFPDYLKSVQELIDFKGEDIGFPCGPYLNPVGVSQQPKYWSYKDSDVLSKSLQNILQCLKQAGLPWLDSLRDPKTFAANVDPMAVLDAALSYDFIGDTARARSFYEEIMRCHLLAIERLGVKLALDRYKKEFIFVAKKLGVEKERTEQLQREVNYYPDISPIP